MDLILDNSAVTRDLRRSTTAHQHCRVAARGRGLTWDDKLFLDYVTQFTLGYLLPDKEHHHSSICFTISKPRTEFHAQQKIKGTSLFRGTLRGRTRCDIWMLESLVNWNEGKLLPRYEGALPCLMHELMHVKQYLSGELVELSDTEYRYFGRVYNRPTKDNLDGYYNQPFEVQAYGHEIHLVERFKAHWRAL